MASCPEFLMKLILNYTHSIFNRKKNSPEESDDNLIKKAT